MGTSFLIMLVAGITQSSSYSCNRWVTSSWNTWTATSELRGSFAYVHVSEEKLFDQLNHVKGTCTYMYRKFVNCVPNHNMGHFLTSQDHAVVKANSALKYWSHNNFILGVQYWLVLNRVTGKQASYFPPFPSPPQTTVLQQYANFNKTWIVQSPLLKGPVPILQLSQQITWSLLPVSMGMSDCYH